MNPRVSRSSALASKATGFPIAKIAAKLAVGYRLDEIRNDITLKTPACFEPTIDYVVVKIPKWQFEKFPGADPTLGTQMKSVGEVMAIGRTFKQALWKGMRSLETGKAFGGEKLEKSPDRQEADHAHAGPPELRSLRLGQRLHRRGNPGDDLDRSLVPRADEGSCRFRRRARRHTLESASARNHCARQALRHLRRATRQDLGRHRNGRAEAPQGSLGVTAVFNRVDTCAAEFESFTPYLYSSYETSCEADPSDRKKVMILGSGPNRIGQGIEFDYCCCHASFALQELGVESIMVNCNPETVSTDYDTSDRLYFEPLTLENVLNIFDTEKPDGVIVQFGGQTPLTLALPLKRLGVPIIGTDPENIDLAEDRKLFGKLLDDLQHSLPRERHRHQRRRGLRGRAAHRLPGAGAPQLRAGRARHGHRLRRGDGPPVHARGGHLLAGAPRADRPLPRRRHRSRRGCPRRRRRRADRRHHGAHRRSRRALRRQLLRAAAAVAIRRDGAAPSKTTPCGSPRRSM